MKDMLGTPIKKGDLVAYGARSGNTGKLKIGIITDVEKGSIISGTGNHRTYDWKNKKDIDEYDFVCSGVQGHGVDGSKLLRLGDSIYSNHPDIYDTLREKAEKFL